MTTSRSETDDTCNGWEHYPSNLPERNLLGIDAGYFNEQLAKLSESFCSESEVARKGRGTAVAETQVYLRNICSQDGQNGLSVSSKDIRDEAGAVLHMTGAESRRTEIFLLAQEYSLGPFPIPERLLRKILTRYAVAPLFLDVLRGVSNETRISEESYGNAFYRASRKSQTNIEISYQLKYADHARYDPNFPWQIRQTEVFHRMTVDKGHPQNFWLVFQPVINSRFEKSLQEKVGDEDKWRSLETNPIRQHVMLISAYVDNWREYLASIGKEYQYHRRRIAAVQFTRDEDFNSKLNFKSMQELRALEETVESVPVMLDATSKLVKSLHGMNQELRTQGLVDEEEFDSTASALGSISIRLDGYGDSAAALLGRTRGIIKLVTDALNLRNQNNAAANQKIAKDINETMLNLTMESVDDSYVVRVVTLATLIYLPGSFVASLFGMNFFDFDDGMSSLRIAANSWIYLVVTVPLTLLTALAWWFAANGQKKKRDNKRLEGSDKA